MPEPKIKSLRLAGRLNKKELRIGLLISALTIIGSLAALEWFAYLWESRLAQQEHGWTLVASRRMPLEMHGSADRLYFLFEPGASYVWEGIPVQINSFGVRDDEFAIPKPPDTYRILNVGDSVAFGWEVLLNQTYGKLLEARLNEQAAGHRYEVINIGVPGWTLRTSRNFLLDRGFDLDPDLILLDVTLVNDIYGRDPGDLNTPNWLVWLRDNTHAWPFLTMQWRFLRENNRGPEAIPALNPPRTVNFYFPTEQDDPFWDYIWETVEEMAQASRENGADFALVIFPTAFQLNSANHPRTPQRVFETRAALAGIPVIDLTPVYEEACAGADLGACEDYENLLFADVWMHPNRLGHDLAAQAILGEYPFP